MWCVVCGKPDNDLSESAPYVSLTAASTVAAWAAVIAALVWVAHHPSDAIAGLTDAALWVLYRLFGVTPCAVICGLQHAIAWIIVIAMLSYLLPGDAGPKVRKWLAETLIKLPKLAWTAARSIWRSASFVVGGHGDDSRAGKKSK